MAAIRKNAIYLQRYDEIVNLYARGLSYKEIEGCLGIGRTVICKALRLARERGEGCDRIYTATRVRLRLALAGVWKKKERDNAEDSEAKSAEVERMILQQLNADFVECLRENHPSKETGPKKRAEVADSSLWRSGLTQPPNGGGSMYGSPAARCVDE